MLCLQVGASRSDIEEAEENAVQGQGQSEEGLFDMVSTRQRIIILEKILFGSTLPVRSAETRAAN